MLASSRDHRAPMLPGISDPNARNLVTASQAGTRRISRRKSVRRAHEPNATSNRLR